MKIETLLFAYNRPDHTKAVLEGLRLEKFDHIKVFVDAPNNEFDEEAQLEINKYLEAIDWADLQIVRRETSFGLARSIVQGVSESLESNDAVIVLEDDCVPMKSFKKYMHTLLAFYKDVEDVTSVCGYRYPHTDTELLNKEIFALERFCPWGWATWSGKWKHFIPKLADAVEKVSKAELDLKRIGKDLDSYCRDPRFLNMKMDIWSLNWILSQYLANGKIIYPKYSLIDNIGFDGSGVHSEVTEDFNLLIKNHGLDEKLFAESLDANISVDEHLQEQVIEFLESTSKMTMIINESKKVKE